MARAASAVRQFIQLLGRLRSGDPLNQYLVLTSAGIVWVAGVAWLFYRNPLTDDKNSVWGVLSFSFIRPWMKRHPLGSPPMKLSDLPEETIQPGGKPRMVAIARRFEEQCSGAGRARPPSAG